MARRGYSDLPGIIKRRREEKGLTQGKLAEMIGINSAEFISMIEAGVRRLDFDKLPILARALNFPVKKLCRKALQDTYPVMYQALFGTNKVKDLEPIPEEEIDTFQVSQEAYLFWSQFKELPDEFRKSVMKIVQLHYRCQTKAGKSSGIPQL